MKEKKKSPKRARILAYAGLIFVIFIWGIAPLFTVEFLKHYSTAIYNATGALISGIALLIICFPKLKKLNKDYLKIAVPTGFFVALASLLQKIGLQYTTPTQYAFLENLSCVVVPVLTYFFVKKKPGIWTVSASVLCLVGCFVLSGMDFSGSNVSFGIGEILCALAGVLYGVNIAATGAFAKKLDAPLYVLTQTWVQTFFYFAMAISFNLIKINGEPMQMLMFSWDWQHLLSLGVLVLVSSTLGWMIRTNAMKYVNASVVAVMMPFSSVVTGISSVIVGMDALTLNLTLGGGLVLIATLMSGVDDILENKKLSEK